jgi:flagellar biosynthesis/type III secretory pathway chaperone
MKYKSKRKKQQDKIGQLIKQKQILQKTLNINPQVWTKYRDRK